MFLCLSFDLFVARLSSLLVVVRVTGQDTEKQDKKWIYVTCKEGPLPKQ